MHRCTCTHWEAMIRLGKHIASMNDEYQSYLVAVVISVTIVIKYEIMRASLVLDKAKHPNPLSASFCSRN